MNLIIKTGLSIIIFFALFPVDVFAESPRNVIGKIDASMAKREISRDEAAMYKTFFLFDRSRLPARFLDDSTLVPIKNATLIIRDLKRDFDSLLPQTKETLRPYLFKSKGISYVPKVAGTGNGASKVAVTGGFGLTYSSETENFNIQWGSAINVDPSYVTQLGQYLEAAWTDIIINQGYSDPMPGYKLDVYIGATDATDVYYSDVPIYPYLYGYVSYYNDINFPYMVVNHDYSWSLPNDDPDNWIAGAMKVTVAHEYFHVVHLAMDYWEDSWWMEASATWMEDEVFNYVNDYVNFINSSYGWTKNPNASLFLYNGRHEYGSAIWAKHISESWGGAQAIKSVWDKCKAVQGSSSETALNNFFKAKATTLTEEFKKFAAKNAFMNYSEGENYGKMLIRSSHSSYPVLQSSDYLLGKSPDYMGSNYIQFKHASGTDLTVTFEGDEYYFGKSIEWGADIVLSTLTGYSTIEIPLDPNQQNGSVTIPNYGDYSNIYLVVTVLSKTGLTPSEYSYTDYYYYPDGIPYTYHACEDCTMPQLPLDETSSNNSIGGGSIGNGGVSVGQSRKLKGSGGSCFIATAAYGYYDEPHVMLLREFRDKILLTNEAGRSFVDFYYRVSPDMADFISQREWLRSVVRIMLLPLIGFAWLTLKVPAPLILALFIISSAVVVKLYYSRYKKEAT